jgi:hypothetical protein
MLNPDLSRRDEDWIDGAVARFQTANAPLIGATRALLERIAATPALQSRLLNTLSMLEHIGSHKIMATQHSATIDQATLRHVAEEAHHAYFMKRQAEKTAGRALDYREPDLLAAPSARMYFQRLEAAMVRRLDAERSARAAYLYMSMVIEFRALWFYGLYQQTLKRAGLPISLKRILGEEQNHLVEMARRLEQADELDDRRVDAFVATERRLYERMLGAIEQAIA